MPGPLLGGAGSTIGVVAFFVAGWVALMFGPSQFQMARAHSKKEPVHSGAFPRAGGSDSLFAYTVQNSV
jgi:hypothetical protein